ncbi:hypothetical protein EV644_14526 [Kribbella orskensis]|uniref:Sigma-70-like protein n=1 Tax=Kribbella orskensis TaxID=2512216 RepID=A0ABY2B695_9ACTN|nr:MULTISPECIES: hypothetical protein [Kribbella]TCN28612.1 hypothetical protein EV642_14826 [Kribbella sp. VKM Ac-2500]TCO08560.1 hypothetical protein EV644_14526 [Kribbella orskensis]
MTAELQELLTDLTESNWAPEPSRRLARGIEERIVAHIPSRLRIALGPDEAAQIARVVAWERCKQLAADPPQGGPSWGYLANKVRWRLADAVRANTLRSRRHPLTQYVPEQQDTTGPSELGTLLDEIVVELSHQGLPMAQARRYVVIAAEGPRFERSSIVARLIACGATRAQGEGFAWLLRGGAAKPSALARLAAGHSPSEIFRDPVVCRWLLAATGLDPHFSGGRSGLGRNAGVAWRTELAGPGLARTA